MLSAWCSLLVDQIFRSHFCVDLRTMALTRVCLGLILLYDVYTRYATGPMGWRDFYSEDGFQPKEYWYKYYSGDIFRYWSLHLFFDDLTWVFRVHLGLCVLLILGIKARLCALCLLIMHLSLGNRAPVIQEGGDSLAKISLCWAMLTPLGTCMSVESLFKNRKRKVEEGQKATTTQYYGVAPFGLLLQPMLLYFFLACQETDHTWQASYNALWLLNNLKQTYTRPAGEMFSQLFGIGGQQVVTCVVWWTQYLVIPVCILWVIPCPTVGAKVLNLLTKLVAILCIWVLNMGLNLCLWNGLLPYYAMVSCLPLLPSVILHQIHLVVVASCKVAARRHTQAVGGRGAFGVKGHRTVPLWVLSRPEEQPVKLILDSGLPVVLKMHIVPTCSPASNHLQCRIVHFDDLQSRSVDINSIQIEYTLAAIDKQQVVATINNEITFDIGRHAEYRVAIVVFNKTANLGNGCIHLKDEGNRSDHNEPTLHPTAKFPSLNALSSKKEPPVVSVLATLLLLYSIIYNYGTLCTLQHTRFSLSRPLDIVGRQLTDYDAPCSLFAPHPLLVDTWAVIIGYTIAVPKHTLVNGSLPSSIHLPHEEEVNLKEWMYSRRTGLPPTEERPQLARHGVYQYPNSRWQRFWVGPQTGEPNSHRLYPYILRYLCRNWNEGPHSEYEKTGDYLNEVELITWMEPNNVDPTSPKMPPSRDRIFLKSCPPIGNTDITEWWEASGAATKDLRYKIMVHEDEGDDQDRPHLTHPGPSMHQYGKRSGKRPHIISAP